MLVCLYGLKSSLFVAGSGFFFVVVGNLVRGVTGRSCCSVVTCRRSGAFDWLLGRQEEGWTEEKVFFHNFAGMALRGLAWTAPQGYLLYHLGYGWHHSVSGCMMGLAYTLGYLMPPYKHIPTGTGWSELLWGYWIWVGVIVSGLAGWLEMMRETCGGGEGHTSRHTSAYLSSYIRKRWLAVAFEVWNALITVIFIFSTVYYALVQQNDVKNKGQTFFGMFVISFVMLAAQLVVLTSVWLTKKKDIDLTYELRAVAILCESPLILRNRVRFHFHHHPNMDEGEQFLTYSSAGQGHKNGNRYGSVDVPEHAHRDLGFESDASSQQGMNRRESKTPADLQNDTTQSDVSDSETEEVDLSRPLGALDEPGYGKHIRLWLRGVEYALWHVVEMCTLTSAPAVLRLVIGLLSLLGCLATACITTAIVVWNIHAPRFLIVCQCTQ